MDLSNITGFTAWNVSIRRNFRVLWHNRTQEGEAHVVFLFMQKGRSHFEFGNRVLTVPAGYLVCFENSALNRQWPDPDDPPSYVTLQCDLFTRFGNPAALSEVGIPLVFKPDRPKAILAFFFRIRRKLAERSPDKLLQCSMLGLQMLRLLAATSPSIKTPSPMAGSFSVNRRIAPILDFLRMDFKNNHSIRELALKAGMHPETFRRLFKKTTGLLPKQYVLMRKIEQAKQNLLTDYYTSLQDLAEELGFCDYSNFHRIFRKIEGVSPQKYRETHLQGITA